MTNQLRRICTSVVVLLALGISNVSLAQTATDITARIPIFKQVYETAHNADMTVEAFQQKLTATEANLQAWQDVVDYYNDEAIDATEQEKQAAQRMYARINFILERQ